MYWPGQFWLCLLLPQLLVGCVIISSQRPQPGPAAWLTGGLGLLLVCLGLGCLPSLGVLWLLGTPGCARLARRLRRPLPSSQRRLRLALREVECSFKAQQRQAKVACQ